MKKIKSKVALLSAAAVLSVAAVASETEEKKEPEPSLLCKLLNIGCVVSEPTPTDSGGSGSGNEPPVVGGG